jgi:hypothetical protein
MVQTKEPSMRTPSTRTKVALAGALAMTLIGGTATASQADAPSPSLLGQWQYISGPAGALEPGQDVVVQVTQAADGTLVGTLVASTYPPGPCGVGSVVWRNVVPTFVGNWSGEQRNSCTEPDTFMATTFTASESGNTRQVTGPNTWWLKPL